jgi:methylthioribose-1-phosphate isomerase
LGRERELRTAYGGMAHLLVHGVFGERFFQDLRSAQPEEVFVTEIRPNFEGARKTAARIAEMGIKATLVSDNMVAFCMWEGKVKRLMLSYQSKSENTIEAMTGTDLFLVSARYHGLPISFYPCPMRFPEQGNEEDLFHVCGIRIAPEGVSGWLPFTCTIPLKEIENGLVAADDEGVFHLDQGDLGNHADRREHLTG